MNTGIVIILLLSTLIPENILFIHRHIDVNIIN